MANVILIKILFITAAPLGIFWNDFVSLFHRSTFPELVGISIIPILSIIYVLYIRRHHLSFTLRLRPNNPWGLLLFVASLILLFSTTYYDSFSLLRSFALISFILGLTFLLFNSFLVKLIGIQISTIGILLLPQIELSIFITIALFSLILSLLSSRSYRRADQNNCPYPIQKELGDFTFCMRCGEMVKQPEKKFFWNDIWVLLFLGFLIIITSVIQIPVFSTYLNNPTIWRSNIYGYEDVGLFKTSGYLGNNNVSNSQYSSYLIENIGAKGTLQISIGNKSFVDKEFKAIQSENIVSTFETKGKSPVSKYKLIDKDGKIQLIAYWSSETVFIYELGFKSQDLSFFMKTFGDSTPSINLLEETSTDLVETWSEAQRNSQAINRFWIFYRRVSNFIPLIPVGLILFSISSKATKKDYDIEIRTENALNLGRNEKIFLASLISASSNSGSATVIDIEKILKKISSSDQLLENIFNILEKLYEMDIVEPVISTNSAYPLIKWKPKFPSAFK